MNVLVACETSGRVRDAFRARGHNAWSCDILPCDADPKYHIQGDVLDLLSGKYAWVCGRTGQRVPNHDQWDLMIAHPPCTYLCNSGVRWLWEGGTSIHWQDTTPPRSPHFFSKKMTSSPVNIERWMKMLGACRLFELLWKADIPRICIENPIMHRHATSQMTVPRYSQIIQPWQFGHGETKATCLWLKNLPLLKPTQIVNGRAARVHRMPPGPDRWKKRSITYAGIAAAMAEQWG